MAKDEEPGFRPIGHLLSQIVTSASNVVSIPTKPSGTSETTGSPKPGPMPPSSIGQLRGATGVGVLKTTRERPLLRSPPSSNSEKESMRQWCAMRLKEMETDLARCSAKEAVALLKALCVVYGTPEEFDKALPFYVELLPYPAEILKQAVEGHMKTSKWFPKPAELIALCDECMWPFHRQLDDARADLEFVNSGQYQTIDEYLAARARLYGPREPGDYSGNRGSSAVNATPETTWRPSSEVMETLNTWKRIPFDGSPEKETSATDAPEDRTKS